MDLLQVPPIGYLRDKKWKSHEDFRGNGSRITKWVPRPDVSPLSFADRLRLAMGRVPLREDALSGVVYGRTVVSLLSPAGDLMVRGVADNVITNYGKEFIRNAMRLAVACNQSYTGDPNGSTGSLGTGNMAAQPQSSITNAGLNYAISGHGSFLKTLDGVAAVASTATPLVFRYGFASDVTTAESATENTVPAGTYSPFRTKDYASSSTLTHLNTTSGLDGSGNLYFRWDFGTGEANGTWNSIHLAASAASGQAQGARNLLAAPVTKTAGTFMKIEYTISISLA